MKTKPRPRKTAIEIIFTELAYEFPRDDRQKAELKIKRRLRNHGFRRYSQTRVDLVRGLKDTLQSEIGRGMRSPYFLRDQRKYADIYDFDVERLSADLARQYPAISAKRIKTFVCFAIFLYWMR